MVMERERRGKKQNKKNLEIILCRFPSGALAASGVLTPNDKKH